jgi:hypothetical protein
MSVYDLMVNVSYNQQKKLGIKNHAQFLFKLRYPNQNLVSVNKEQIQSIKNAGFNIF